jgi:O-antigen ligase
LDGDFYRAYGTFEQPNPYAGYLGMVASVAIGALAVVTVDRAGQWGRAPSATALAGARRRPPMAIVALLGLAASVLAAALGMSWSRGAWVGFGAALLAMAVALPRRTVWGVALVAGLVVAFAGLYGTGLLPPSISTRLTGFSRYIQFEDVRGVAINDANYSVIERLAHWQSALEMLRENTWLGVGFGAYEAAYRQYDLINWPYALGHAHNYYLTVAAEAGIIGLLAYLVLWSTVVWQTWRAGKRARGIARGAAIGLLGAWTHLGVHSLLDNLYVNNVHLQIGVMLGILGYVLRTIEGEDSRR